MDEVFLKEAVRQAFEDGVTSRSHYVEGAEATNDCINHEWPESNIHWIYGDVKELREAFERGCSTVV